MATSLASQGRGNWLSGSSLAMVSRHARRRVSPANSPVRACNAGSASTAPSSPSAVAARAARTADHHQDIGVYHCGGSARVQRQPHRRGPDWTRQSSGNDDQAALRLEPNGHRITAASSGIAPVYRKADRFGRSSRARRYTSSRSLLWHKTLPLRTWRFSSSCGSSTRSHSDSNRELISAMDSTSLIVITITIISSYRLQRRKE